MYYRISGYFVYARIAILLLFTTYASANDSVPTFNLKNKSRDAVIALVIHAKDANSSKKVRIRKDNTVYEGLYTPSKPIFVPNQGDISYYDLRNVDSIEIYHMLRQSDQKKPLEARVMKATFNNVNDSTTFYVKYCVPYAEAPFGGCSIQRFGPQEGVSDKLFGKKTKTTDGYSLERNVTEENIFAVEGVAGAEGGTYTKGIYVKDSPGMLPILDTQFMQKLYPFNEYKNRKELLPVLKDMIKAR